MVDISSLERVWVLVCYLFMVERGFFGLGL